MCHVMYVTWCQVLILIIKGESLSLSDSVLAATYVRSNEVKIITVYVGQATSDGYSEQRSIVTNVGELAILRVDRIDELINRNKSNVLHRAADIPAPITS